MISHNSQWHSVLARFPVLHTIKEISRSHPYRIDKTCYSVFSPNKIPVPTVTIKINDTKIKCVKECKYLGVIIDNELKWTLHIEFVLHKLKRLLGIFIQIAL